MAGTERTDGPTDGETDVMAPFLNTSLVGTAV